MNITDFSELLRDHVPEISGTSIVGCESCHTRFVFPASLLSPNGWEAFSFHLLQGKS